MAKTNLERMIEQYQTIQAFTDDIINRVENQGEDIDVYPAACYNKAHEYQRSGNIQQAIGFFKKATDGGHAGACYELVRIYMSGDNLDTAEDYANQYQQFNEVKTFNTFSYNQKVSIGDLKKILPAIQAKKNLAQGTSHRI